MLKLADRCEDPIPEEKTFPKLEGKCVSYNIFQEKWCVNIPGYTDGVISFI